jgi:hypothetical protein
MTTHPALNRRRSQRGGAVRGILVVTGLAAAVALQLAGPQLQCRLASLVGIAGIAPTAVPAGMAAPMPVHGLKVAVALATAACAAHVPAV